MADFEVNEKSSARLTVIPKDFADAPAAPVSATYRIDEPVTGTQIRADTALTPSTAMVIELKPSDNTLLAAGAAEERRVVTVKTTYGADDALNAQQEYVVKNLKFVT